VEIETKFEAAGRPPIFSVQSECKELVALLNSRGFTSFDKMSIMQLGQLKFKKATDLKVMQDPDVERRNGQRHMFSPSMATYPYKAGGKNSSPACGGAFCNPRLREEGRKTLASSRRSGHLIAGVYCVGTRVKTGDGGRGSMIHEASKIASAKAASSFCRRSSLTGPKISMQRGFRRLYLKHLMRRKTSGLNRSKKG